MITNLEIQNYQSHKNSSFEFVPGMNVITGSSDAGKSSVVRAMIWGLRNRPSGDAIRRWGTDAPVRVAMEFDDGWFIKSRTKAKNMYETEDGTFEALRSDVPESIQTLSNITDYNLQTQFQSYCMLQDSPGDRARALNQLVNLDIIDRTMKKINGSVQKTKAEITVLGKQLVDVSVKIDHLSYLPAVASHIDLLSVDINRLEQIEEKSILLRSMMLSVIQINEQIAEQKKIAKAENSVLRLTEHINRFKLLDAQRSNLSYFGQTLYSIEKDIERWCKVWHREDEYASVYGMVNHHSRISKASASLFIMKEDLKHVESHIADDHEWLEVEIPFKKICKELNQCHNNIADHRILDDTVAELSLIAGQIKNSTLEVVAKTEAYTKLLKDAGVCPTCGSKIK
jgi:exonuclease SbcC